MKQTHAHPKTPVNMTYVNHGKVFGKENWYTFYCGKCGHQVWGSAKECEKCGSILQSTSDNKQINRTQKAAPVI